MSDFQITRQSRRGRPIKDLRGRKYGFLLPLERERIDNITYWRCACLGRTADCKRVLIVPHSNLTTGNKRSCGCLGAHRAGSSKTDVPAKQAPYYVLAEMADYNRAGQIAPFDIAARWQVAAPAPKVPVVVAGVDEEFAPYTCPHTGAQYMIHDDEYGVLAEYERNIAEAPFEKSYKVTE